MVWFLNREEAWRIWHHCGTISLLCKVASGCAKQPAAWSLWALGGQIDQSRRSDSVRESRKSGKFKWGQSSCPGFPGGYLPFGVLSAASGRWLCVDGIVKSEGDPSHQSEWILLDCNLVDVALSPNDGETWLRSKLRWSGCRKLLFWPRKMLFINEASV